MFSTVCDQVESFEDNLSYERVGPSGNNHALAHHLAITDSDPKIAENWPFVASAVRIDRHGGSDLRKPKRFDDLFGQSEEARARISDGANHLVANLNLLDDSTLSQRAIH